MTKRYTPTESEIRTDFTHYAMMFGVVPVYYNVDTNVYCVRNWCPRLYGEIVLFLVTMFWMPILLINQKVEPKIWIRIGKKINK